MFHNYVYISINSVTSIRLYTFGTTLKAPKSKPGPDNSNFDSAFVGCSRPSRPIYRYINEYQIMQPSFTSTFFP